VAAGGFRPPRLIPAFYGVDFGPMPGLPWMAGDPRAVAAMVISAILPLLWFKKKGWL